MTDAEVVDGAKEVASFSGAVWKHTKWVRITLPFIVLAVGFLMPASYQQWLGKTTQVAGGLIGARAPVYGATLSAAGTATEVAGTMRESGTTPEPTKSVASMKPAVPAPKPVSAAPPFANEVAPERTTPDTTQTILCLLLLVFVFTALFVCGMHWAFGAVTHPDAGAPAEKRWSK